MHLLDLPDDALQLIQTNAQQPGGPIEDVWCRLSIYEHRIRNKVVTQLILSGMVLDDLEWQRFLSHFESRASARVCSVFSRTEVCGARTVQFLGTGIQMQQCTILFDIVKWAEIT